MDSFVQERSVSGVSVRKIAKHFKVKRSKVNRYLENNPKFYKVNPVDVGSGKVSVNVWKLK